METTRVSTLIRWSGLAALAAGLLFALGPLAHPPAGRAPPDVDLTAYAAGVLVIHVGHALALLGLVGLLARQVSRAGPLLVTGFLLAFLGTALGLIPAGVLAFMYPYLSSRGGMEMDTGGPPVHILAAIMLPALLRVIGFALFGIATARIGLLPRAAGVLLAIGGPLFVFLSGPWLAGQPLSRPGGLLVAVAFVWLGYALWRGSPAERAPIDVPRADAPAAPAL